MPRKGIICSMCGGEFFERSFPIHQKACAKKQQHIRIECQHCSQEIPKLELEQHLARCPKAPKLKAQPQTPSQNASSSGPISGVFDSSGRLQCAVCGRWFNADRVAKHQGICSKISQKQRPIFDSFKQRKFDPQIKLAAPSVVGRSCNTPFANVFHSHIAARSYYNLEALKQPVYASKVPATRSVTTNRVGVPAATGRRSVSQSPQPSSRRSSNAPKHPVDAKPQHPMKAGNSLRSTIPPTTSARGQISPGRGTSGQGSCVQSSSTRGRLSVSRGEEVRSTSIRGGSRGVRGRQPFTSGRFQDQSRCASTLRTGRVGPKDTPGGLSTSNVCSEDNPLAYPSYPS